MMASTSSSDASVLRYEGSDGSAVSAVVNNSATGTTNGVQEDDHHANQNNVVLAVKNVEHVLQYYDAHKRLVRELSVSDQLLQDDDVQSLADVILTNNTPAPISNKQ